MIPGCLNVSSGCMLPGDGFRLLLHEDDFQMSVAFGCLKMVSGYINDFRLPENDFRR